MAPRPALATAAMVAAAAAASEALPGPRAPLRPALAPSLAASAQMAGMEVVVVKSMPNGDVDLDDDLLEDDEDDNVSLDDIADVAGGEDEA